MPRRNFLRFHNKNTSNKTMFSYSSTKRLTKFKFVETHRQYAGLHKRSETMDMIEN